MKCAGPIIGRLRVERACSWATAAGSNSGPTKGVCRTRCRCRCRIVVSRTAGERRSPARWVTSYCSAWRGAAPLGERLDSGMTGEPPRFDKNRLAADRRFHGPSAMSPRARGRRRSAESRGIVAFSLVARLRWTTRSTRRRRRGTPSASTRCDGRQGSACRRRGRPHGTAGMTPRTVRSVQVAADAKRSITVVLAVLGAGAAASSVGAPASAKAAPAVRNSACADPDRYQGRDLQTSYGSPHSPRRLGHGLEGFELPAPTSAPRRQVSSAQASGPQFLARGRGRNLDSDLATWRSSPRDAGALDVRRAARRRRRSGHRYAAGFTPTRGDGRAAIPNWCAGEPWVRPIEAPTCR